MTGPATKNVEALAAQFMALSPDKRTLLVSLLTDAECLTEECHNEKTREEPLF